MPVRLLAAAAILAVVALYCYYMAGRLHRLHRRMDAAAAALDAQLRRRGVAVTGFAAGSLDEVTAARMIAAVAAAAEVSGLGRDREIAENALSRALSSVARESPELFLQPSAAAREAHDQCLRAIYARRFYNDTVRNALVVRDRRAIRWLRLAGRAPLPSYFEMDDEELPTPRMSVEDAPTVEA